MGRWLSVRTITPTSAISLPPLASPLSQADFRKEFSCSRRSVDRSLLSYQIEGKGRGPEFESPRECN